MNDSPCLVCTNPCADEDMCDKWQDWFAGHWERARYNLGVIPPNGSRSGRPPTYIYEARDVNDGTVISRGTAVMVARDLGCSLTTVRTYASFSKIFRKKIRITSLEVGGDYDGEDRMES